MALPASRRAFLKLAAVTGLSPILSNLCLQNLAFATTTPPAILIVVHLRGGCDGLNLISPANDPNFISARIADLRVCTDGPEVGYNLVNPAASDIDFRLHASAVALSEFYASGQLAFVHAAGIPDANRSHFAATDMLHRGVGDVASLSRVTSGWLGRYLATIGAHDICQAVYTDLSSGAEYAGNIGTLAVPDLSNGFTLPGGPLHSKVIANSLEHLYTDAVGDVGSAGRSALEAIRAIEAHIHRDAQGRVVPYASAQNVDYERAAELGRGLRTIAQIVRMELGLTVASVELGGWDTHENQRGRFKMLVERLSAGLSAFWNDMAAYHDRLILVTVSEFGRRLRSNTSHGTDHGRAGVIMVLSGNVSHGRMYGVWPGLADERLEEGIDLRVSTDYRQVLTEVLLAHSGLSNLVGVFPNFKQPERLGILSV